MLSRGCNAGTLEWDDCNSNMCISVALTESHLPFFIAAGAETSVQLRYNPSNESAVLPALCFALDAFTVTVNNTQSTVNNTSPELSVLLYLSCERLVCDAGQQLLHLRSGDVSAVGTRPGRSAVQSCSRCLQRVCMFVIVWCRCVCHVQQARTTLMWRRCASRAQQVPSALVAPTSLP